MDVTAARGALGVALALAIASAGCSKNGTVGSTGGGSAKVPSFAKDFQPPTSGCGSFRAPMPADPEGAIASLDASHRKAYGGYFNYSTANGKILKSAWRNWKPKHGPPYDVAIIFGPLTTDWQVQ